MARHKNHHPSPDHPERRSRGEIDRNYFFGDVLIKTGVALALVLGMIALATPVTLGEALREGMWGYLSVMGGYGLIAVGLFLTGRHLRKEATHWDFD